MATAVAIDHDPGRARSRSGPRSATSADRRLHRVRGASRFTKDIDFLVDDAPANVARVKQGLLILADHAAADVDDSDVHHHTVVRVVAEVIVDLMATPVG